MKILIDTNILISAALSSNGTPFKAYVKAVSYPNNDIICEQNIDELRRIFNRKFPKKLYALEEFLALALPALEIVPTPETETESESQYVMLWTDLFSELLLMHKLTLFLQEIKIFLNLALKIPKFLLLLNF